MTAVDDFLIRALAGGLGVAAVAGPFGCFIVWRRMAFFGGALAHAALLGVALGLVLGLNTGVGILLTAVVAALLLAGLERQRLLPSDTLLGIVAHATLATGLVLLAFMDTLRVDLMSYLFGDILAVGAADLAVIYGGGIFALATLAVLWRPLLSATVHEDLARVEGVNVAAVTVAFMVLIAIVIAVALKVVGILLVVSLLVIPAAAARRLARTPEQMAVLAALAGCLAVAGGLGASLAWDTPSGPSIVVAATLLFLLSLGAPQRVGA